MSGTTVIVAEGCRSYVQLVTAGPHVLIADEPGALGGGNTGPSPADLLLASLGTCVSITLRMYADRHGWPLGHIKIELSWMPDGGIRRDIQFGGGLTNEQTARLIAIAGRCPISKLLKSGVPIETALAIAH